MKTQVSEDIITDTLLEWPVHLKVDGRPFTIYPVTLGKSLIISSIVRGLEMDKELLALEPVAETMRLASKYKEETARIIAVACARGKKEVFGQVTEDRASFFKGIKTEDRASLLNTVLMYDRTQSLYRHFELDKEMEQMRKATEVKKDGSDLTFCGKSLWGQLIDPVCERYGWTMDYVMWGISYNNLQMLVADQVKTVFLTDEERKKLHLPERGAKVYHAENMTAEEMKQVLGIR